MYAYSDETRMSMAVQASLDNGAEDKFGLASLYGTAGSGDSIKSYADLEKLETFRARQEQRMEEYNAPLTRELESIFEHLGLPPLPPPLPKAIADSERAPWRTYINKEVSPFTTACQEGSLDIVKYWATEKRGLIGQVGLQHGLSLAAWKDQTSIVQYLLSEGGAYLDSAVIEMACRNLSLPMFELAIKHRYHPNQQMPSSQGRLSTALTQCLDSFTVTEFLLTHGADPDLGPWQDFRRHPWRRVRAAPPMDRQCGIALDLAVRKGNLALAELLLNHGAHVNYARPIHELIKRKIDNAEEKEWKPFMDLLCRYGADVNADQACHGPTPYRALHFAVHMGQWGIVEELLIHGADPHINSRPDGMNAFQVAAGNKARRPARSSNRLPDADEMSDDTATPDDAEIFLEIFERVKRGRMNTEVRDLRGEPH